MPYPAPAKQETSATIPYKKITTNDAPWQSEICYILHLPGGQRIITYSRIHGSFSFRVLDLETGAQVGEEWEDKAEGVQAIALSPDHKIVASGSSDGVRLWNIDTGKVIKKWTGHTDTVWSVCWSSDGGRVVSGSSDGTFRVWDVESGRIILGPIMAGDFVWTVCYSPNTKMIATGGDSLKIWDANTGELLATIKGFVECLLWAPDGKTLIAGQGNTITKFDTVTWTESAVLRVHHMNEQDVFGEILLSPNARVLAVITGDTVSKIARLWNLETNQRIHPPLYHEGNVMCAAFSADGMFLTIGCFEIGAPIYKWDLSAIVKDASLLSNNVDVTQRPVPKIKVTPPRRIPPGFFDDARRADLSTSRTQSYGQHNSSTTPPHQRTLPSFWHLRFNRNGETEHNTQSWSIPFSWTRNLVSGMVHRRDAQDIELREPPIVDVPCTAGKPRNYHARRKKPAASSSQTAYSHPSQQQPPIATASTLPAVANASGTTGTITHPHIAFTGWRARLMAWVCCMPIQNAN